MLGMLGVGKRGALKEARRGSSSCTKYRPGGEWAPLERQVGW